MLRPPRSLSRALRPLRPVARRLAIASASLTAATALSLSAATPGLAVEGSQYELNGKDSQYGEVTRFGGFDSTWYDAGAYDGSGTETEPTPSLFLDPVGFAVDSEDTSVPGEDKCASGKDENAIWVLDRTNETSTQTAWRLQKLDDCGEVLGSTAFTLPHTSGKDYLAEGLAVDQATKKIYTLIVWHNTSPSIAVAREVLEWSIEPVSTKNDGGVKELVAPSGAKLDALSTATGGNGQPGLLAGESTLESTASTKLGSELYEPQGIAIDDATSGQYLAIEAAANDAPTLSNRGPTVIQQISQSSGQLGEYWDSETGSGGEGADELDTLPDACTGEKEPALVCEGEEGDYGPAGLSTNPADDGLTVLLRPDGSKGTEQDPYNVDAVGLSASLEDPTILSSEVLSQEGTSNPDGAAISEFEQPFSTVATSGGQQDGPSAAVVALSNGLYAATFYNGVDLDNQNPADNHEEPTYWTNKAGGTSGDVNLGIRLLDPARELAGPLTQNVLSNPEAPLVSVFDTLGQATGKVEDPTPSVPGASVAAGEACNVNAIASLAAGADGTVWVITRGIDSKKKESTAGRQVIELAPGAAAQCPSLSSSERFTIEGKPANPGSPVVVSVGSTVQLGAAEIKLQGRTPYAYYGERQIVR